MMMQDSCAAGKAGKQAASGTATAAGEEWNSGRTLLDRFDAGHMKCGVYSHTGVKF